MSLWDRIFTILNQVKVEYGLHIRAGRTVAAVALQVVRCRVYCNSVINKFPMTSSKLQIAWPKQPRRATIVCTTEASVWVLDRSPAAYGSHVTRYLPVLSLLSNLGNPPEVVDGWCFWNRWGLQFKSIVMPVSEDDFPSWALDGTSHTWCGRRLGSVTERYYVTSMLLIIYVITCYYFVTVEYIINSSSCQRVNWGWLPWGKPRAKSPMTESWNLSLSVHC